MSHKTSPARRAAFLKAVAETGNQTLAAERAKVSRSWVQLHRSTDPEFDAAVRAAIAAAKESLAWAPGQARGARGSNEPPRGWGFLDGEELVVRGTNGRRVQVARARLRQWTPRSEDRFLAVLAATCNVDAACAEVGLSPASAYEHRKRWPAFARRWREAIKLGSIRLQFAQVQYAGNPASSLDLPEAAELPPASFAERMHCLHMHQHETDGIGARPGGYARPRPMEEVYAAILSKIEAIEAGEQLNEAVKEEDRREWALRRPQAA